MYIESFTTLGLDGIQPFIKSIKDEYYSLCDKDLSFVLFDEEQTVIGFVLLLDKSIPEGYIIDGEIPTKEKGVEILQIYCAHINHEPSLLKILRDRVTIWCKNGDICFDYIWSIKLENSTHFFADVLNGYIYNAIISKGTKKQLLYSLINRSE